MLTEGQRKKAQDRWTARLDSIEVATGVSLLALTAAPRTAATKKIAKLIEDSRKADDPSAALMSRVSEIKTIFAREFGKEEVVAATATAFKEARRNGLGAGAVEGVRRVQEDQRAAVPVSNERLAARRKQLEDGADPAAAAWMSGTIDAASKKGLIEALIFVGTAVDVFQIAGAIEKTVTSRIAGAARNEVVGAARAGVTEAFRENGQQGWLWIAEDDACDFCWGMSGLVFPIDEEMESHPNCRCSQEPVEDINDPGAGFDPTDAFRDLPESEQVAILGRGGYEEFKDGMSLREIPAQRGAPVRVNQIRRDVQRERVPQADKPEHLPGYEPLPGAAGRFPAPVQDFIRELTDSAPASALNQFGITDRVQGLVDLKQRVGYGDKELDELARLLGKDGRPTMYADSQIDEFVQAGEVEIFRGVDEVEYADGFINGAYESGNGIFGSGWYSSTSFDTAKGYTPFDYRGNGEQVGMMRMTLKSDAKVMDYEDFTASLLGGAWSDVPRPGKYDPSDAVKQLSVGGQADDIADAESRLNAARREMTYATEDIEEIFYATKEGKAQVAAGKTESLDTILAWGRAGPSFGAPGPLRKAVKMYDEANAEFQRLERVLEKERAKGSIPALIANEGNAHYAAMLDGYDAIRVSINDGAEHYYIILNREAVRVSDATFVKQGDKLKKMQGELDILRAQENIRIEELAYERSRKAEELSKTLNGEMEKIADAVGAELVGLQYSVKDRNSLARKARKEIAEALEDGKVLTPEEAIAQVRDANRFTMTFSGSDYTQGVERTVRELTAQGFTFPENLWRNSWKKGNSYRGLNTNAIAPDGSIVEIQFHTADSFATKQRTHKMYEEERLPETPPDVKERLKLEMQQLADDIEAPDGWERLLLPPRVEGNYAPGTVKPTQTVDIFTGQRGDKRKAADQINAVMDELNNMMRLPMSRSGQPLKVEWFSEFPDKGRKGANGVYSLTSKNRNGEYVSSEIGIAKRVFSEKNIDNGAAATFIHEFGHFIDGEMFDGLNATRTWSGRPPLDIVKKWSEAVHGSRKVRRWVDDGPEKMQPFGRAGAEYMQYVLSEQELWARSFAQWFALRSQTDTLTTQALRDSTADLEQKFDGLTLQWDDDDFEAIAEAFDQIFKEMGWVV